MQLKITKEEVLANMQDIICETRVEFGKPTTYVCVKMKNGFTVRESTTCVDPSNYDEEIGKEVCLKKLVTTVVKKELILAKFKALILWLEIY